MTVLDEVLQAEATSATKIAEAKTVASQQVADAQKAHTIALETEKNRLSEAAAAELVAHEQTVQKNSQAITAAAEKEVEAIKAAFAAKTADLTKKISDTLA